VKIILAGDTFLRDSFSLEPTKYLFQEYWDADFRVANLEQAIGPSEWKLEKSVLCLGEQCISEAKKLKIDAFCLANNHIHDLGIKGIKNTIKILKKNNIGFFGAGENIDQATDPYFISENLALLGFCEFNKPYLREIMVASDNTPGVAGLSRENINHALEKLPPRAKAIIYFHWGLEHSHIQPSANIKLARDLLEDERVSLIVGMHPHVVQGQYCHNNKYCFPSLGHFYWPDFLIKPPNFSFEGPIDYDLPITKDYLDVKELTLKVWRKRNRYGRVLQLETENMNCISSIIFTKEKSTYPKKINSKIFSSITVSTVLFKFPFFLQDFLWNIKLKVRYLNDVIKKAINILKLQGLKKLIKVIIKKIFKTNKK